MADAVIVTLVNQTGKLKTINLFPISDKGVHLPAFGRTKILEEEVQAHEVQGGLKSVPPTLAIIYPAKKQEAVEVKHIPAPAVPETVVTEEKPAPKKKSKKSTF